nr:putative reverse transcriptase domain-containing protein [Tanacetum cinerariifolium]
MQAACNRQKSYADIKCKTMEFQVGDKVMLKVSPWKRVVRFGKRGKLNPRYVGPFKVLERSRDVPYKLDLPEELSRVHNTFHVPNLKKCHADEPLAVPLDGLHFDDKLQFMEEPVEIMDREVKRLKQSQIPLVKVRWNSKRGPVFMWQREDQFRKKYPHLFARTASTSNVTYIGPFKVLERIGDVAYKLDLLEELSRVHNTFHVSNLKKCHADEPLAVSLDGLHFDDKLQFMEEPVEIVDREVKRLKQSRIPLVKPNLGVLQEDIGEFIVSDMSDVVMGRPFRAVTQLEYDCVKGLISFSRIFDTYIFQMPRTILDLKH